MRKTLVAIGATGLMLAGAVAANAEGNGTRLAPPQQLHTEAHVYYFADGADQITGAFGFDWSVGSDSPSDAKNSSALRADIPGAFTTHAYYALAYSERSMVRRTPVENMRNLSFEFRNTETFGGGAPRISVQFDNGDVAYLSAEYCDNPLAVSPSWSRADFTGRKRVGCSLLVTGETAGTYSSDGWTSAWGNYVAANPDQVVVSDYLVVDAQAVPDSTGGTYSVDRLALGTRRMYNRTDGFGVRCLTERAC